MTRITLLALSVLSCLNTNAQSKIGINQPYIEVRGNADTLVVPNEIYLQIIISEKDTKDKISIEELEKKMVEVLRSLEIDTEKNLATSAMSSNFQYYLLKSKDIIKTKTFSLKLSDANTCSRVFLKLEEIGIANIVIERINHSGITEIKNKLLSQAVIDAQTKAVSLTAPLNQEMGLAINITEVNDQVQQPFLGNQTGLRIRGIGSVQNRVESLPEIEFEKIKLSVAVDVRFSLK